ncbi:alpha/beta fold hydrolase [Chondromyces apiculatus]|uniref:Alpha/beta hydrolase fold protein n=1 Tax=Chondromyces apiculatus DSM 436 TaxID=1192034 RepID=A0A017TEK5_9BACT|nr:alpha/beta hydrolase [Chondromyces apiculatus]EYF07664.1 alpha/beta hydrolase fold protein [Chondromyces apiculatus DSM 436]
MTTIHERARRYEQAHDIKESVHGTHRWRYAIGKGTGDAVLLLTGGMGLGLGWLDLALAFEGDYRPVIVDYPPTVTSLDAIAEGALGVLDAERISWAHVIGQSAGGMAAELLSRRAPDRVRTLTFSGSGLYGPEDMERLTGRKDAVSALSPEVFRAETLASFRATWKDSPEVPFWLAQIEALLDSGAAQEASSGMLDALVDLARRLPDLERQTAWQGPTLIIRASDDPLITETQARRLIDLHPDCELLTFPSGGHSLLLTRPDDYIKAVKEHLARHRVGAGHV